MVFSTGCAGWCLGKPGSRPSAHGLLPGFPALLKMGIMMLETC